MRKYVHSTVLVIAINKLITCALSQRMACLIPTKGPLLLSVPSQAIALANHDHKLQHNDVVNRGGPSHTPALHLVSNPDHSFCSAGCIASPAHRERESGNSCMVFIRSSGIWIEPTGYEMLRDLYNHWPQEHTTRNQTYIHVHPK